MRRRYAALDRSGKLPPSAIPDAMPVGAVVLWGDDEPPDGWSFCDGKDGTPDLRPKGKPAWYVLPYIMKRG